MKNEMLLNTIISRGDQITRTRDYYDVYILSKLQYKNIDIKNPNKALIATSQKRGTLDVMRSYKDIIETCYTSKFMKSQWLKYQDNFSYAKNINFEDTCATIIEIMDQLVL